jgi:hypothetical protein
MASPITLETLIGYIEGEDIYIRFTEYYGNGTIYGRTELSMPDGSPVKGMGKFKKDLVEMGVVMSDFVSGSLTGDLTVVPVQAPEVPVEVPVEVPAEVPAEVPEVPAEVPAEVPVAPADVPVEVPEVPVALESVKPKKYTVVTSFLGFKITREFLVRIDEATNTMYLDK